MDRFCPLLFVFMVCRYRFVSSVVCFFLAVGWFAIYDLILQFCFRCLLRRVYIVGFYRSIYRGTILSDSYSSLFCCGGFAFLICFCRFKVWDLAEDRREKRVLEGCGRCRGGIMKKKYYLCKKITNKS